MKSNKSHKITEFVIRYTDKKLDDYLVHKGFFAIKKGIYENLNSTSRIEIQEGIKFVFYKKGSVYGDPEIQAELNFIPDLPIIDYILKQIKFIKWNLKFLERIK